MSALGAFRISVIGGPVSCAEAPDSRIWRNVLHRASISFNCSTISPEYRSIGTPADLTSTSMVPGEFSDLFHLVDGIDSELTTKMMILRMWSSGVAGRPHAEPRTSRGYLARCAGPDYRISLRPPDGNKGLARHYRATAAPAGD